MIKRLFKLIGYFVQFFYFKSLRKNDQIYQVIYKAIDDLGGIYVKLIQFLSLRTDFLPDQQKMTFLCFFDSVTPQSLQIIDFLYNEIGQEKLNQFHSISPLPFASGTFGQVYKAKLTDGSVVVIKVKRDKAVTNLKTDIIIIKAMAWIFNLIYYQRLIDVNQLIKEFTQITLQELNYLEEVKNAQFFYQQYRKHPVIFIPKTYADLSTNNIIVQEYVGGIPMTDLIRMKLQNQDIKTYLAQNYQTDLHFIIKYVQYAILIEGLQMNSFYADPHPGNIKILSNNKYGLIDFGIVAQPPGNRRAFYEIVDMLSKSIVDVDIQKLSQEFLKLGSTYLYKCLKLYDEYSESEKPISNTIINKYQEIVESHKEEFRGIEISRGEDFQKIFFDMFKMGERFNMHLSQKIFSVMRASSIAKSFALVLDPNYHCMRDIFGEVAKDVDGTRLVNDEEISYQTLHPETAMESLMDWIGNIAEYDPALYNKIKQTTH